MSDGGDRGVARAALERLTRLAFWAVVILSPWRARWVVEPRQVGSIWHDYTDLRVFWVDVALGLLLALWLAGWLRARRQGVARPIRTGPPILRWAAVAFLVAVWAGVPGAVDPAVAIASATELTGFVLLGLYVRNEVRAVRELAVPVALMLAVQAVPAVVQVWLQGPVGAGLLGELPLDPMVGGYSIVGGADGSRLLRGYGLSDHPNIVGGVLVAGALLLLAVAWPPRGSRAVRDTASWAAARLVVLGLSAAAIGLTFSRAAWIAVIAGLAIGWAVFRLAGRATEARRWLGLGAAGVAIGAIALAPYAGYVASRVDLSPDRPAPEARSLEERVVLARAALDVMVTRPLLGTGLGGLPEGVAMTDPALKYPPQPAHVVLLTAGAEVGIAGALAFAVVLLWPWLRLFRRRAATGLGSGPPVLPPDAATAYAVLAAVIVVGLFDYWPWAAPAGRAWTAIAVGLVAAVLGPQLSDPAEAGS